MAVIIFLAIVFLLSVIIAIIGVQLYMDGLMQGAVTSLILSGAILIFVIIFYIVAVNQSAFIKKVHDKNFSADEIFYGFVDTEKYLER